MLENRVIKEINDDIIAGFATPEILQNDLKEPGYEKYFVIPNCNVADDIENKYLQQLYKKTYILQIFFEVLKRRHGKSTKDFFKDLEEMFQPSNLTPSDSTGTLALETALRCSFGMLHELKSLAPGFLVKVLESIYSSLL